jgi:hypothetical protein
MDIKDATILLTEEEINSVRSLQNELQSVIVELGSVELQLNDLNSTKNSILAKSAEIRAKQEKIGKELSLKYGNGTIDLNTGTFESSPK